MDKITCIIIDDVRSSLELLEYYAKQHPQLEVLATFSDSIAALKWLQNNVVDLIITDIDMAELNGIDLVRSLIDKPLVILCTGHLDYALPAHQISPIDFLVKPVGYDQFSNAIEKAALRLSKEIANNEKSKRVSGCYVEQAGSKDMENVDFDDIKYIEYKDKYLHLYCLNKTVKARITLKEFLEKLPVEDFMRIHRSFIIALPLIERLREGHVVLRDVKKPIPLGNKYAQDLRDHINERNFKNLLPLTDRKGELLNTKRTSFWLVT